MRSSQVPVITMVATRRSQTSSGEAPAPTASELPAAGSKRSGGPSSKKANKSQKKENDSSQKTIEETSEVTAHSSTSPKPSGKAKASSRGEKGPQANGKQVPEDGDKVSKDPKAHGSKPDAVRSSDRKDDVPSSILEKGLIYFFVRARVGVEEPSSTADLARSYIVLRPLPHGAALATGPAATSTANNRVLTLPKKVLPRSPKDRFMVFVDQAGVSASEVEQKVLQGSDYTTQTMGSRHAPAATPVAEGVYALTETGEGRSETHLAYVLTLPDQLGEVQREVGLAERGSFVVSAKNPKFPGPAQGQLPKAPEFPKEVLGEFGSLRWSAAKPKMFDYVNAQFLLIGTHDDDLSKANKVQEEDEQAGKEEPKEEIEKLEAEDEIRVEKLSGDHAVFEDLRMSRKDYEGLKTTW